MKSLALLAAGTLLLAACNTTAPDADMETSGGSVGERGDAYCESVPNDPTEIENWNTQCMPDSGRR
jgi:hypothetical protein